MNKRAPRPKREGSSAYQSGKRAYQSGKRFAEAISFLVRDYREFGDSTPMTRREFFHWLADPIQRARSKEPGQHRQTGETPPNPDNK